MRNLPNKMVIYMPSEYLSDPDFQDIRDDLIDAAGGLSIQAGGLGYWKDAEGVTVAEPVSVVTVLFTEEDESDVTDYVADLVNYLHDQGEVEVLAEAYTTEADGGSGWLAVCYSKP